jgi:DNA-binding CsgD family transcriptional regulator
MRSTLVRGEQVRGLLQLAHEAREIGAGAEQHRHMVQGIARLVGAEFVTILVDVDFAPGRRGEVIEHVASYVDGSIQLLFDAYRRHGTAFNPGCRVLMARTAGRRAGDRLTHARRELMRDADWYGSEFVTDYQRACGLDDFVYSVQVTGRARVSAVTATRALRGKSFDEEDVNLVDLFHEEYARLVRPAPRAGGPRLSPRGREVLGHLLHGASEKAIAAALSISRETVHGHVKAIYAACGVSSRAELLARCLGSSLSRP